MSANTKRSIILCSVLIIAAAAMAVFYFIVKPQTGAGQKNITIEVVTGDSLGEVYTIKTNQEYLGPALIDNGFIEGEVSEFGMFITVVNGLAADSIKEEWWCLTKAGEDVFTGVDLTPVYDGDVFELTLKKGFW